MILAGLAVLVAAIADRGWALALTVLAGAVIATVACSWLIHRRLLKAKQENRQ